MAKVKEKEVLGLVRLYERGKYVWFYSSHDRVRAHYGRERGTTGFKNTAEGWREAEETLQDIILDGQSPAGKQKKKISRAMTMSQAIEKFYQEKVSGLSPHTQDVYDRCFRLTLTGDHRIDDTEAIQKDLVALKTKLAVKHKNSKKLELYSPRTIWQRLEKFSCLFGWLIKKGHLQTNPVLEEYYPLVEDKEPDDWSDEEFLQICAWMLNNHYPNHAYTLQFLVASGLRESEALGIQKKHISLETREVTVFRKAKRGKKRKEQVFPLSDVMLAIIEKLPPMDTPEDYLFRAIDRLKKRVLTGSGTYSRILSGNLRKVLYNACRALKIDIKKRSLHAFRRKTVNILIDNDVNPAHAAQILDHSILVMMTVYKKRDVNKLRTVMTNVPMPIVIHMPGENVQKCTENNTQLDPIVHNFVESSPHDTSAEPAQKRDSAEKTGLKNSV